MQPATCPVNFGAYELRQDQKDDAREVHRQRAPADPAVVNQTSRHKRKDTDSYPVRLLAPEIRRVRISARRGCAVNRYNPEGGEREHRHQQKPVLTEQLSQKGRHEFLVSAGNESDYTQVAMLVKPATQTLKSKDLQTQA